MRRKFIIPERGDIPVILSTSLLHMTAYSALIAPFRNFCPPAEQSFSATRHRVDDNRRRRFLFRSGQSTPSRRCLPGPCGPSRNLRPRHAQLERSECARRQWPVLLAALCWAANIVYVRAHKWISTPFQLVFWQVLLAFIILSTVAAFVDGPTRIAWTPRLVALLLYSAIVCTALAYWAMSIVNRSPPAVTTSLGLLATPALGIVSGAALLDEPFELSLFAALALIVGGIAIGIVGDSRTSPAPR
jgi:hypothetical protein